MKEQLEQIRREALAAMDAAADSQALETLRVKYLGKKGELTAVLKMMGKLSAEERPVMGQVATPSGPTLRRSWSPSRPSWPPRPWRPVCWPRPWT